MNATPESIDLIQVRRYLESLPDVANVHYVHAWNLSSTSIAFSAHVEG